MTMSKWLQTALAALSILLAAGCATVPMAPPEADAKAKTFAVEPGKANIYVYRNESFGGAITMTVALNGKLMGQTGPQTYFFWQVDPGKYEIQSIADNTSTVALDVQAGKNYFVWQEVKMGLWMARSALQTVDEATGRKGVAECKRIQ
jgi:starvation-inducible outer membrane lipoprotein